MYKGQAPLYDVHDDGNDVRAHILKRLRRLCTIPDDTRLADVAKQTLKEAFAFKREVSGWKKAVCGSKASAGASIAGPWLRFYRPIWWQHASSSLAVCCQIEWGIFLLVLPLSSRSMRCLRDW